MIVSEDALMDRRGIAIVQQAISKIGFVFREQPIHDVGIDAHVEIVENDKATGRLLALQIKSGKSYFREETNGGFVFRCEETHLSYWLHHALPVLLVLCDTEEEKCYWQWLAPEHIESTGKHWKVLVPRDQVVDSSAAQLVKIATRLVPIEKYNLLSQKDTSFVLVKRYSLDILLCGSLSKAEIGSVVRQVVRDYVSSKYNRDEGARRLRGDADAQVISLFVYLTLADRALFNWLCRALWIDERLPESQAPLRWKGEDIGDSIIVEWSERYNQLSDLSREYSVKKGDFLQCVRRVRVKVDLLVATLEEAIEREKFGEASVDPLLESLEPEFTARYFEGSRLGVPPIECRDVDLKFRSVIALAHNLVMPFFGRNPTRIRNKFVERMQIDEFRKELKHLDYELEKVR